MVSSERNWRFTYSVHMLEATQRNAARIFEGASPVPRRYEELASKGIPNKVGIMMNPGPEAVSSHWMTLQKEP
jgi:hypothetical protein